jgi:hypothetical protein
MRIDAATGLESRPAFARFLRGAMMADHSRRLPPHGAEREALREKGQFWTPLWVAEAMVAYLLARGIRRVFDPAAGAGAFLLAAKKLSRERGIPLALSGAEIDPAALMEAERRGLTPDDLKGVRIRDFLLDAPEEAREGIVANPPYIRHHRIPREAKDALKILCAQTLGEPLDGRAGLHIHFLIRSLSILKPGGRLAFLMPADSCEGVFAPTLWRWIARNYRLDAVIAFQPQASPFPGVDTNAVVFLIENAAPEAEFRWVECLRPETGDLADWIGSGFQGERPSLAIHRRSLAEGIASGLSRPPLSGDAGDGPRLLDYATAKRGIAAGANDFFFLTRRQIRERGLPEEFFIPAIGRVRDAPGACLSPEMLRDLDERGRPTFLLSLDGRPKDEFPAALRRYLERGEAEGIPQRPVIARRRPWHKMERRPIPPLLFAYLGRRDARFVRNLAGAVPLTGFLCVYPRSDDPDFVERLWRVLSLPQIVENLARVGKSYGGGAIKVEPRALERLPIPADAAREAGLPLP